MTTINWKPNLVLPFDPDAVKDYDIDFTAWLAGETLASLDLLPVGCTAVVLSDTATGRKVRVSAVTCNASLTFRPTAGSGVRDDFTVFFQTVQQ